MRNISILKSTKYGIGALSAIVIMAAGMNNCKKGNDYYTPVGMTKEQIADYVQQAKVNNEPILKFYDEKAEQDSIAMVEAIKALNGIDMNRLKQKHDKAMRKRIEAQNQIDAARKVSTPEVVKEKEKEASEVMDNTYSDIHNYTVALKNKRLADGEEYSLSKYNALMLHSIADDGTVMLNENGELASCLKNSVWYRNGKKVFVGTTIEGSR